MAEMLDVTTRTVKSEGSRTSGMNCSEADLNNSTPKNWLLCIRNFLRETVTATTEQVREHLEEKATSTRHYSSRATSQSVASSARHRCSS
jgi:hypothetical protein